MKKKKIETSLDLANMLSNLFNEVDDLAPDVAPNDEIDVILREAGYEPDEFARNIQSMVHDALKTSPLNWRNRARKGINEERERFNERNIEIPTDRDSLLDAIRQLLQKVSISQQQALSFNRNFASATDDDLATLFEELKILIDSVDKGES